MSKVNITNNTNTSKETVFKPTFANLNVQIYALDLDNNFIDKLRLTRPNIVTIDQKNINKIKFKPDFKNFLLMMKNNKLEVFETLANIKKDNLCSIILIDNLSFNHLEAKNLFSMGVDLLIPNSIGSNNVIDSVMRFIAKDLVNPTIELNQKGRYKRAIKSVLSGCNKEFSKINIAQQDKFNFTLSGYLASLKEKHKLIDLTKKLALMKYCNLDYIRVTPPYIPRSHLKERISTTLSKYSDDIKSLFFKVLNQRLIISGKMENPKKLKKLDKDLKNIKGLKSINNSIKI